MPGAIGPCACAARLACVLAAALATALAASLAFAHALLLESTPAAGAVVPSPPRLVLRFNSRVEPRLSSVVLVGPGRRTTALASPGIAAERDRLVYDVPALEPGSYAARWRVFSADGHVTEGVLAFRVSAR